MTGARPSAGFTLLELLVALVVFGILMAGLTQGVHFGLHARAMQTEMLGRRSGLETADRVLRDLIGQMDPGIPGRPAAVAGTAHGLRFASVLPAGASGVEAQPIDAVLAVDAAHRLLLRWVPRMHAVRLGPAPQPADAVLAADVDHVEIAYWRPRAGGGGAWVEDWRGPSLPSLVRMKIVFPEGDTRRWPAIIAMPMRQSPGA